MFGRCIFSRNYTRENRFSSLARSKHPIKMVYHPDIKIWPRTGLILHGVWWEWRRWKVRNHSFPLQRFRAASYMSSPTAERIRPCVSEVRNHSFSTTLSPSKVVQYNFVTMLLINSTGTSLPQETGVFAGVYLECCCYCWHPSPPPWNSTNMVDPK